MAKQGQHNNDANDQDKSKGHNNPSKSVTITTGSPKKKETYDEQAQAHQDTGRQAQADKNEWVENTREAASHSDANNNRSGSQSNAS